MNAASFEVPDFRALFESAPGCYLVLRPDLTIVAVSDAYLRAMRTKREEILGHPLFEIFPDNPDDPSASGVANLRASLERVLTDREADSMAVQKYDIRRPESAGGGFEERFWCLVNSPVFGANRKIRYIIHRVEDVTDFVHLQRASHEKNERTAELRTHAVGMEAEVYARAQQLHAANERLQMTNKFLDSIVENIPNMIFVKDAEQLRFDRINRAGEELLGLSRGVFLGKNDFDFFPPEQAQFFTSKDREVLKQNVVVDIPEEPIETAHGRRWLHTKKIPVFDDQGTPRYLLGISEDITERKQLADRLQQAHEELERRVEDRTADLVKANDELQREIAERQKATEALGRSEEQLRQAQKMEAIGRLAGGIAHDFNNMLSVILGYSALIGSELAQNDPVRGDLREIEKAASRAADLTKQLLAFSRQQVMAPKIVNLNEVIAGMDKMLRRVIGEDVELRIVPTPHVGRVKVDPGQIEQVILNLVVNARDAMPNGGMLTIETGNAEIDEKYAAEHIGAKPGAHVMLAVTDTGIGMDAPTQARIFEPFFTTKEQGKGTGLGLSTVFGIVQQSQGTIWLYSEPGRGTSFKVYLPRTREIADVLSTHSSAPPAARGSETILLVEDEEQVRVLARNILKKNGYQVIEAQNAGEALLLCERFSGKIHLLVTDVVMPKVSGRELVERLSPQRPEMKVLFMSGYTDDTVVHHGVLDAGIHYLQKPLTPDALGRKVREVLDL